MTQMNGGKRKLFPYTSISVSKSYIHGQTEKNSPEMYNSLFLGYPLPEKKTQTNGERQLFLYTSFLYLNHTFTTRPRKALQEGIIPFSLVTHSETLIPATSPKPSNQGKKKRSEEVAVPLSPKGKTNIFFSHTLFNISKKMQPRY